MEVRKICTINQGHLETKTSEIENMQNEVLIISLYLIISHYISLFLIILLSHYLKTIISTDYIY